MQNPWLEIPLSDYEGHMSAPNVRQLSLLSHLFKEALGEVNPASVAVLGIAGGNGLEHVDRFITRRICGFDIHPGYLAETQMRFGHLPGLELRRIDLARENVAEDRFDLVHAALVFEHAGMEKCFANAVSLVRPGGVLSVVLQLPSREQSGVAPTGFRSLETLAAHFVMIPPEEFRDRVAACGFTPRREETHALPGGKHFWHAMFDSTR